MRALALAVMMLTFAIGCAPITDVLGTPETTPKAPYTNPPPTPTLSPIATVAPTGHGRPYTPEMMVAELMDVPYNFPRELQTDFVAAALADRIWTFDGRPYRELSISGSCDEGGLGRCDLSVSGLPAFAPNRETNDHYYFSVNVQSAVVIPGASGLEAYPPELGPEVDALVRSLDTERQLQKQGLRGVEWALPPPDDAFRLVYGGDNEGDLMIYVTLDRANRQILSLERYICCDGLPG